MRRRMNESIHWGRRRFAVFWVNSYAFAHSFRFESLIATTLLHEAGEELPPEPPDTED
jgi:hypothetical protein